MTASVGRCGSRWPSCRCCRHRAQPARRGLERDARLPAEHDGEIDTIVTDDRDALVLGIYSREPIGGGPGRARGRRVGHELPPPPVSTGDPGTYLSGRRACRGRGRRSSTAGSCCSGAPAAPVRPGRRLSRRRRHGDTGRRDEASYDRVASDYAAEIAGELTGKPFDRGLLDAFTELAGSGTVADVGCGPGHVGAYLAARDVAVVGLDLSPEMCAIARRTTPLPTSAADMTALPLRSGVLSGLVCMYAVIHLDTLQRAAAYREFARVLADRGHALIAFHTSDAEHRTGESKPVSDWWGHDVDLTFRFLDAGDEVSALDTAGLELVARLDRRPHADTEHQSQRSYLVVRRPSRVP